MGPVDEDLAFSMTCIDFTELGEHNVECLSGRTRHILVFLVGYFLYQPGAGIVLHSQTDLNSTICVNAMEILVTRLL